MEPRLMNNDYVRIFDTTLRDGEQSPGATMTSAEKLEVARALARMGVDIIEAGFPAASPDDFEAVRRIAVEVGAARSEERDPPIICALARGFICSTSCVWTPKRSSSALPRWCPMRAACAMMSSTVLKTQVAAIPN